MKTRTRAAAGRFPPKPTLCRLLAGGLALWLPLAPALAAPSETAAVATASAVDGLVRATRLPAAREPFRLEAGPADPQVEQAARDELEQAIMLIQEKDYAAAAPLLEDALKIDPTVEATWEALGWCYYHLDRVAEAESLWEQFAALRPESPKAHNLLAQLAIARSDWSAADRHLARALDLEPNNYDVRYWYAQNLFRLGRLDPAVDIFEKLVAEDAGRFDVKTDLARTYSLVQRHEDALDLWTEIVEVLPENLAFRTEFARALMLVGSLDQADAEARRILEEDPARWDVMNLRADLVEIGRPPEEAVAALRDLIADAADPDVRAQLQVRLGARLVALNRKDADRWPLTLALEPYAAATDARPTYVPWLNQYSQIALMAHRTETARDVVDRILRDLNPHNQQALKTRFEIEMFRRDFPAAERALDAIYEDFQPDNPYRFLQRARLEVQRGDYPAALEALDRLEEIGNRGAVLTLLYHGLTESEWLALPSTRRFREHLLALRDAGFTFIDPLDIPAYLEKNAAGGGPAEDPPWLAQQVDQARYALTGERKLRRREDAPLAKVVAITFDDGLRSSLSLGTPVAQELGLTFGMFVITSIEELNAPMYAAWEELRAYRETGAWQIGSHLKYANTPRPAGAEGSPDVFPLPNRLWRPEKKRLETLREWTARVRREFSESRADLEKHLELPPKEPLAVAYPFGEIGQEEGSNVARLVDPVRTLLGEAAREYPLGFVVDSFGYTCPGDDLLTVRRFEPAWNADAADVVEQVLENHPVFQARRMRVEIATLMNKPYLADRQIELLRRDGYPERRLRELVAFAQNRIPAARAVAADEADRRGTTRNRLRPSNLYVAGAYRENQSNDDIVQRYGEGRAGLNLSARLGLEVSALAGRIDQTVTSNVWYEIEQPVTSVSSSTTTTTTDGDTTTSSSTTQTTTINKIQTNRITETEYDADVAEVRGTLTLRLSDAASLTAALGFKTVDFSQADDPDEAEQEEVVGSLTVAWSRLRALRIAAVFEHDLVASARREISYDGFGLNARWLVSDRWELAGVARYLSYEDDNAMVQLSGSSFWQLFERQGIWGGLEASTYSTDEDSEFYWTPYWDTRYAAVLRLLRAYQDYFFQFDVRLGQQREDARPEDERAWRNLKARADADGNWDAGSNPDADWDTFVGLGATYRQRLWRRLDLVGNLSVNFLRDYSEHDFTVGLQYNF
ncbi:MAG: tetratricopeptide repeat protein [Spartobacteria bacterium]|nr:tetratricopeptide repeat protein [Spartobacteria bacterium]